jgi:hypothetical protein
MRLLALVAAFSLAASPVLAQTRETPPPQAPAQTKESPPPQAPAQTKDLPSPQSVAPAAAVKPIVAKPEPQTWETGGKTYTSYEDCVAARKKAEKKGAIIGAVVGGGATALLGGNLGKSALGAGAGALVGSQVSKGKKC